MRTVQATSEGLRRAHLLWSVPALVGLATILSCAGTATSGGGSALLSASTSQTTASATTPFTFARDVAPILQQNCQICHQKGSIGPMPLTTYEEVKPFAALIRQRVSTRTMPPWHMDPSVGIKDFKNDISLSDEEIKTIVAWAEGGAPLGNP